jgi:hypothetical protein
MKGVGKEFEKHCERLRVTIARATLKNVNQKKVWAGSKI